MRTIKFRAKIKANFNDKGEWLYFILKEAFDHDWYGKDAIDWKTLGEFTGLNDKKRTKEFPEGQEIYEGDITNNGIIRFGECSMTETIGFYLEDNGQTSDKEHTLFAYITPFEVIGNIYENKDLL